ncbi:MAG: C_GCAxxG_C_C family protein [Chitinivibrionales bacterium]|nr:C_GCAxxG_C_C family protein [Chitinivibrionales bacterium]
MSSDIGIKAQQYYQSGQWLCTEAVFTAINDMLQRPVPPDAVRISSGFPGGIGMSGCSCGALTGGIMGLGLRFGRTQPGQDNSCIIEKARQLHDWFKSTYGSTCCRALTKGINMASDERKSRCVGITGAVAEKVAEMITTKPVEPS